MCPILTNNFKEYANEQVTSNLTGIQTGRTGGDWASGIANEIGKELRSS